MKILYKMKRAIFSIILVGLAVYSFAQSCDLEKSTIVINTLCPALQTTLNTNNCVLKTWEGIVLKPGFQVGPTQLNGHSFTATLDNSLVKSTTDYSSSTVNSAPIPTLDKSNYVPGTIGGSTSISPSGGATYQLPIQVSPGSHGMQPNLSVVLSSQAGNGLLGWGCNLAGLSSISRISKNTYYDSDIDAVSLTDYDALALDGEHLIKDDAGNYYPANNPYTKVIKSGNTFTVTTQDGMVMEYGKEGNSLITAYGSNVPISWGISRITDPEGNYIQFIYAGDNNSGEYVISEIKYTGNSNSGKSPYNSVKFYYSKRTDSNSFFIAGAKVTRSLILNTIKVFNEGVLSKDYQFTYFNDQYSKLYSISLVADGIKYNPTYIKWKTNVNFTNNISDTEFGNLPTYKLYSGDFNGDGITDIAQLNTGSITVKIAQADGSSYSSYSLNIRTGGDFYNDPINPTTFRRETSTIIDLSINDWNNDGKDEILVHSTFYTYRHFFTTDQDFYSEMDLLDAYNFKSGDFERIEVSGINSLPYNSTNKVGNVYKHYFADLNNDGIIEQITTKDKTLFSCTGVAQTNIPIITLIEDIRFVDFDGDGKTDILALKEDGYGSVWELSGSSFMNRFNTTTPSFFGLNKNLFQGDFNGDGKTDYLSFYSNSWHLFFSTGENFYQGTRPSGLVNQEPANTGKIVSGTTLYAATTISISDLDNDGRSDIIYTINNEVFIFISKGVTFQNREALSALPASQTPNEISLLATDLNADGIKEIIYGSSTMNYKKFTFTNRLDQGLYVSSITDGLANESKFTYTLFKDNRITPSDPPKAFPLKLVRGPMLQVTNLSTKNGTKTLRNITNTYSDGYEHMQGLGFLGFSTITSTNSVDTSSVTNSYEYTIPGVTGIYFPWLKTSTTNNGSTTTLTNTMGVKKLNAAKKSFLPIIITSAFYDGRLGTTTTTNVVDFNETLGRVASSSSNKSGWITSSSTAWVSANGNISKPTSFTTSHGTYSNTISLGYESASSLRVTSRVEKGVTTTYGNFDSYGNPQSISLSSDGGTRNTSSIFESKGRFVATTTNVLGGITNYTYRASNGSILTEQNAIGTTSYSYSAQGGKLVVTVTYPDGRVSTRELGWDVGDGFISRESVSHGNTLTTYFNSIGQKVKQTAIGYLGTLLTTTYDYDSEGNLTTENLPGIQTANTYAYKSDGRLKSITGHNLSVSYLYTGTTITTNSSISGEEVKSFDVMGNVLNISSPNGAISYDYFDNGKIHTITAAGGVTTMTYNPVTLMQETLVSPDAGTTTYDYNAFGELESQTDARNKTISCIYNTSTGQLLSKTGEGISETYTYYDISTPKKLGLPETITRNGITQTFEYDDFGRPVSAKIADYTNTYQYNADNRLEVVNYPTGLSLKYEYDLVGNLTKILKLNTANGSTSLIWEGKPKNERQQWTDFEMSDGRMKTKWVYDNSKYTLTNIIAGTSTNSSGIQSLGFDFDINGLLNKRTEGPTGTSLDESFLYDSQKRLTSSTIKNKATVSYAYADNGNISSTSLTGSYTYDIPGKPHTVGSVNLPSGTSLPAESIQTTSTFTADNMIAVMDNVSYKNEFTYGPSGSRFKVDHFVGATKVSSKIYAGESEFLLDNSGNITTKRTFIIAPTGICAVWEKVGSAPDSLYYIHTDNQGSWLKITDQNGVIKNRYSYDAWGRPRDPNTWELKPISAANAAINLNAMQPRFDRGYTGHEHMAGFGLINMNGRLYDPYLQRFLSPDPFVQAPENAQNYNRYTYCLNNPLMYTDPSGYFQIPHYNWSYQDLSEKGSGGGYSTIDGYWYGVGLDGYRGGPGPGALGYSYLDNGRYMDNATGATVSWDEVKENYADQKSTPLYNTSWGYNLLSITLGNSEFSMSMANKNLRIDLKLDNNLNFSSINISSTRNMTAINGGGIIDNVYTIANALNEFNPIAQLWDIGSYALTGNDRFGNSMSLGDGMSKALIIMPVGKILSKIGPLLGSIAEATQIGKSKATIEVVGSASAFFKALNPSWNGMMYEVKEGFSLATFDTVRGGLVRLQSTSSSTGKATVKVYENGYELLFRFTEF